MTYKTILADPPWQYRAKNPPCLPEKQPGKCSVEYYYPVMTLEQIKTLNVAAHADEDGCCLWLWATTPLIREALSVMEAWGWKYQTMLTWHKTNRDCMGYWLRVCTEHLLIGVRGKVRAFRAMDRTLLETPRGKHSQKPEASYALIERVSPEPRLELFARRKRTGWRAWGNAVESDINLVPHISGICERDDT
jgi:N6-adenosine-specific RNA methylase IME4